MYTQQANHSEDFEQGINYAIDKIAPVLADLLASVAAKNYTNGYTSGYRDGAAYAKATLIIELLQLRNRQDKAPKSELDKSSPI